MNICYFCNIKMRVVRVGATVVEWKDVARTTPYKVWDCDILQCPCCEHEVYGNFGKDGLRDFEPGFDDAVKGADGSFF